MLNLYEINMEHYSQKDSEEGIITYLVAESDEEVYEWLKREPKLASGRHLYNSYKYNEIDGKEFDIYDDDYNVIGTETFKDRLIRLKGEKNDEDVELTDLYYGATLLGWRIVKENISGEEIEIIRSVGIGLETI